MAIINTIKANKLAFGLAGVVGIGILAWLAFGYFGIQAAFTDNVVAEDGPVFTESAAAVEDTTTDTEQTAETEAVEETAEAEAEEPADAVIPAAAAQQEEATSDLDDEAAAEPVVEDAPDAVEVESDPAAEETAAVEEAPAEEAPAEEAPAEEAPAEEPAEEAATPGEIVTIASGSFSSLNGYSVTGDALVLNNGTEQRFLRFENFVSDNGPDLKVYLRAANGDFVSLGDLSGNIGDQNYEIPVDVDLSVFSNVEIWCERFTAGFGVATLSAS